MIKIEIDKANKVNGEWALYVSFPYDNKIVNVIRDLPSRFWYPEDKMWEIPLKKLGYLIKNLQGYEFDISGEYVSLTDIPVNVPTTFNFKTKPYQHQLEAFEYGMKYDRWLLGDEMGLGKTKQSIDIAVAKKELKGYEHCLIICGVNGLKWNWFAEVDTHSNEIAHIIGQKTVGGKLKIGSNKEKAEDLKAINAGLNSDYFLITNVESLRNEEILNILKKMCDDGKIGMIVADEVHKMKNPASQQGKAFLKLQAETMIAMTGTPLMNTPMDLYIILKWLGYEKHSFYAFKNHYCVMGGYGGYEIIGYKNLEELQEQLEDIMLRRKKEEVLDLPEKTYIDEFVEMTPKQTIIYNEVTNEIKSNIDMIKTAPNPLAELIRMRQATGYTGILSSTIQESAKLDRMEELVEEAVDNGKQVVIFSNWTQMTDAIYERLHKKYTLSVITGETKDELRQHNVREFQEGRSKVMIGTSGAMGTGLTLTAGTVEIFMDEPWNQALKEQCVDRCHRIGQKENLTIYTLMCKNTIDERIHDLVIKKGAMADSIVDGNLAGNRSMVIDYLVG